MKQTIRKFKETVEMRSSIFNRLKSHRYFPILMLLTAVLVASFIHVWQRFRVLELVHEVSLLKQENKELIDSHKKLHSDITALTMAARIETYARDTLGMQPVDPEQLYTLVPEKPAPQEPDQFGELVGAIERIADYIPVISGNDAMANSGTELKLDTLSLREAGK